MNTKRLLSSIMMLLVTTSLLLAACAPAAPALEPTTAPPLASTAIPEPADPVTVVRSFYQAFNDKDLEKAKSLIAEDYVMNVPYGTYDRDAAMIEWQAQIDSGITFNQTNFVDTGNGRVTSCYEVFQNGSMIDKGCGSVTHVRDGKIVFDGLESGEPIWIAQEFYRAYNEGDLESLMASVAEDIKVRGGAYLTGKDRFRFNMQADLKQGFQAEISDLKVEGDRVTYNVTVYNNAGSVLITGMETLQIKDGLIILIE
jgi:ketosteroid isomerase-like protein